MVCVWVWCTCQMLSGTGNRLCSSRMCSLTIESVLLPWVWCTCQMRSGPGNRCMHVFSYMFLICIPFLVCFLYVCLTVIRICMPDCDAYMYALYVCLICIPDTSHATHASIYGRMHPYKAAFTRRVPVHARS